LASVSRLGRTLMLRDMVARWNVQQAGQRTALALVSTAGAEVLHLKGPAPRLHQIRLPGFRVHPRGAPLIDETWIGIVVPTSCGGGRDLRRFREMPFPHRPRFRQRPIWGG